MDIFTKTKELVKKEKHYTYLILDQLSKIESQKLYSDKKFPTLFKYLVKELKYSESEANTRVGAVRLILKNSTARKLIKSQQISLTNAAMAFKMIKKHPEKEGQIIKIVQNKSTRRAKEDLKKLAGIKVTKNESITLDERIIAKLDRTRALYGGDISNYEILDTLLDEKLRPVYEPIRNRKTASKNSRYIPRSVKFKVNKGKCQNCGTTRNLEYDHVIPFAKGGTNSEKNIQILCRNCNQRKAYLDFNTVPLPLNK